MLTPLLPDLLLAPEELYIFLGNVLFEINIILLDFHVKLCNFIDTLREVAVLIYSVIIEILLQLFDL